VLVRELTANVDFQFTDSSLQILRRCRKLHDEVSVRRQVAGTRQVDCRSFTNLARVLTADGVVPQGRCRDSG